MPDPEAYAALRPAWPVSSASSGEPDVLSTVTGSENLASTWMAPAEYAPVALGENTRVTPVSMPLTAMPLDEASEPRAPGFGRVRLAAFPAASLMPPPASAPLEL